MPKTYFVVRATVADASKRAAFDTWYQKEHLPDATKAFGVTKARLFGSAGGGVRGVTDVARMERSAIRGSLTVD
jgi:hypothetical protein